MDSEQIAAARQAFLGHLLAEKRALERCLGAIDAALHIYTTSVIPQPPSLDHPPAPKSEGTPSSVTPAAKQTAPSRPKVLRQVATWLDKQKPAEPAVERPIPATIDPGPPVAMDFDQVRKWAGERGIQFNSWEDLPRVNERRERLNQPWFKRAFGKRAG